MKFKIFELQRDNGDIDLFFCDLTEKHDFEIVLEQFLKIEGVKIIRKTEDKSTKACLLSNGKFDFILVYSSDSFVWNYVYSVEKENYELLKQLYLNFAEFIPIDKKP